ncbi:WD40-repeat-containing domain protein [Zychaea mexicana]|uniref:WD40-repeat-containing domain protein n=1 Tax=Zychaea mexicana TaxID=64656 RepID=UPI0022FDB656|nr:WD40-repeat-containing domain protein [Zychaea mexicana]KAI9494241.1 WD40-repeat-containing domain protein [Zychaea mexicana]
MLTHAGYIYSLDIPTWNPGQAAVGLGDSNIKIWNFMDNSGLSGQRHNFYESRILWKGLQGQILKVRWHPTRENILAYSTEYGRVGVYDTSSNKCHQFKTYYNTKGSISISWASDIQIGETFVRDAIISCGPNNIAYAFDVKQPTAKAVNVTDWIRQVNPAWSTIMEAKVKTSRCCAAVDPQSRFLALGNTDGAVEVYRLDTFRIVYVANSQQTAVKVLSWRDGSTLLAVGYNSGTITIHNIAEQLYDAPEVPIPNTTPMHTITEHKKRITGLAWSHHQERSLLASTANDEFAYVFDIQNGSAVSCFDQHLSNVLSVCWSAEDMDTLFTGGEDKFCYVWKYTDYPYTTQKRGASGPKLNELMSSLKRSSNICRQPQLLRHCIHLAARIYGGDINEAVKVVKNRIPGDIDQAEYEYAVYAEQELGGDTQDEQDEDSKNLGLFFDDKNAMRELIGIEGKIHIEEPAAVADSYDGRLLLDIIQSNYKAFESSPVNWVALALSPMAGKETWLSLMETQAKHLVKQSQPVLAATCFLACSKIYDAIRVYREAAMYREAIALAKLRLPEEDPIISTLFAEWADRLQKKATQEELAAMW